MDTKLTSVPSGASADASQDAMSNASFGFNQIDSQTIKAASDTVKVRNTQLYISISNGNHFILMTHTFAFVVLKFQNAAEPHRSIKIIELLGG